jgi:hypothetical protein
MWRNRARRHDPPACTTRNEYRGLSLMPALGVNSGTAPNRLCDVRANRGSKSRRATSMPRLTDSAIAVTHAATNALIPACAIRYRRLKCHLQGGFERPLAVTAAIAHTK